MTLTQVIFVPGVFPSANEAIAAAKGMGGRGYLYAKLKKTWTEKVRVVAKGMVPFTSPVHIDWVWQCASRRMDPDNITFAKKYVLDGIVEAGVLVDDSWAHITSWTERWEVCKENPGVRVTLTSDFSS